MEKKNHTDIFMNSRKQIKMFAKMHILRLQISTFGETFVAGCESVISKASFTILSPDLSSSGILRHQESKTVTFVFASPTHSSGKLLQLLLNSKIESPSKLESP